MSAESSKAAERAPLPALNESFLPREHAMYRPRHSARQHTALTAAGVFFCVPLLLWVFGVRPGEFENRKLAPFPTGWNLLTGLDEWAGDHLPLRQQAVSAVDGISRGVFGEPYQFGQQHPTGPIDDTKAPAPPKTPADRPNASLFPKVVEGRDGWLYLGLDALNACHPEKPLDQVLESVRALRDAVEKSGRTFVFTVVPDKSTQEPGRLPASYLGKSCHDEVNADLWQRLGKEKGLLDLRPVLTQAGVDTKAPTYQALDSHWTYGSATVATKALAERVQPGVAKTWHTTTGTVERLAPDLPRLLGRADEVDVQTYDLAPDGMAIQGHDVAEGTFREPTRVTRFPGTGLVRGSVGLIGDSFLFNFAPFTTAPFADLRLVHSDTAGTDPQAVAAMLADRDVVVFETAERSLVGGTNSLLDKEAVDVIAAELAKRPR
ncbi:hypothetical protein [Actinosynnema sp. NPDC020468]|uniref:alginate O-acetyltransferase AlgX-related protein n=1 Tax=Actinosynnema sp. NPDC020468 TaxID=3154488 RepID=UPI0033D0336A